jgi:hypothetical protein
LLKDGVVNILGLCLLALFFHVAGPCPEVDAAGHHILTGLQAW